MTMTPDEILDFYTARLHQEHIETCIPIIVNTLRTNCTRPDIIHRCNELLNWLDKTHPKAGPIIKREMTKKRE